MKTLFFLFSLCLFLLYSCDSSQQEANIQQVSDTNQTLNTRKNPEKIRKKRSHKKSGSNQLLTKIEGGIKDRFVIEQPFIEEWFRLENFYSENRKPEDFNFTNKEDTLIRTKKGNYFMIPAHCFSFKDGSLPGGSILFQIGEFTEMSEFLMADLSTSSNGKLLETGGMFRLQAFSEGKELQLQQGKKITIEVPVEETKVGMELFYGDAEGHNWHEAEKPIRRRTPLMKKVKGTQVTISKNMKFFSISGNEFYSENYDHSQKTEAKQNQQSTTILLSFQLNGKGQILNKIIKYNEKDLSKRKFYIYKRKVTLGNWTNISRVKEFDFNHEFYLSFSTPQNPVYEFKLSKSEMSILKKALKKDSLVNVSMLHEFLPNDTIINKPLKRQDKNKDAAMAKIKNMKEDEVVSGLSTKELTSYVFDTEKLDWINIDRFYDVKGPKTDLIVDNQIKSGEQVSTKIVFQEFQAVLSSSVIDGKSKFEKIPVGEKISVVSIKTSGKKTYLATNTMTSGENKKIQLVYEPVTVSELKKILENF